MKISEITDKNLSWIELNNINLTVIRKTYSILLNSLPVIIKLRSPSKSKIILGNVEGFVSTVDKILNISFPDAEDEDIIKMKSELTDMKNHILTISSQLKL